ncbi:hypothetical protein NE237_025657 [Protea cynaroides]|uniref:Uncharacterized protein n=1 Tax=Protea cynaroides TaxID=273540 RepID=A0A9Q0K0E2_9MAGN|nr:hypothetical protein NE237_025657 [Protea cynaroides]
MFLNENFFNEKPLVGFFSGCSGSSVAGSFNYNCLESCPALSALAETIATEEEETIATEEEERERKKGISAILGSKEQIMLLRVFIGGRYISGAEEIQQLHESGELKRFVEGFPSIDGEWWIQELQSLQREWPHQVFFLFYIFMF